MSLSGSSKRLDYEASARLDNLGYQENWTILLHI